MPRFDSLATLKLCETSRAITKRAIANRLAIIVILLPKAELLHGLQIEFTDTEPFIRSSLGK
ncbi:hypothetical protein OAL23_01055 [bacterium]|nr:hypothetical protein [bacterium]